MPRYVAFLRGVNPQNARMPELTRCFESAGFTQVKTVLSSGNVVFDSRGTSIASIEKKIEAAMTKNLSRTFSTIVRSIDALERMLKADPYQAFKLPTVAKRVVTFLRSPAKVKPTLPIEKDGAQILVMTKTEVFSAYLPTPLGPVFMVLIEKSFGRDVTTRTWDTVTKCSKA